MTSEKSALNATLDAVSHQFIETNGLRMHIAEQGTGPLVLLCHGFPELWNAWRYQFSALSEAGYRVVAPDLRGYGQTDQPDNVEVYTLLHLVGDLIGVLDILGEQRAILVGHDWGAALAWHAALLRPDRFPVLICMSVPYIPRGPLHGECTGRFHQRRPGSRHGGISPFTSPISSSPVSPKPRSNATSVQPCAASCTGFRAMPPLLNAGIPSCPIRRRAHSTRLATPLPCPPGSPRQISICTRPSSGARVFAGD